MVARLKRYLLVLILSVGAPLSAAQAAALTPNDTRTYEAAFRAADLRQWGQALSLANGASDKTLRDVLLWRYARVSGPEGPGVQTRVDFVAAHSDWPLTSAIRRQIEDQLLVENAPPHQVVDILTRFPPVSANGKRALAQAYLAQGNPSQAASLFRDAWINGNFSKENEDRFLALARPHLRAEDHLARADRLVWDGAYDSAQRMVPFLQRDQGLLIQARITLGSGKGNATAAVNAVPTNLQSDSGLVFERVRWRRKKELYDDALALLRSHKPAPGHERLWWREQSILARNALNRGHVTNAYRVAANHGHLTATESADAEFLAGWIALRFLNDPKSALPHFTRLYGSVTAPISRARGAYWSGRAEETAGNSAAARDWYQKASAYPTTFYGQLAAAKIGVSLNTLLPAATPGNTQNLPHHTLVTAAVQLAELRRDDELISFLLASADKFPEFGTLNGLAQLAVNTGRPDYAVYIARRAARHNIALIGPGYPIPTDIRDAVQTQARANGFNPAVTYGLIRQESSFELGARSSANALGLMQLIPGTAQATAKKEEIGYELGRLTSDGVYNTRLGNRYLGDLLVRFDGNLILAAAGYNAGPGRPVRWMSLNGDPRLMNTDDIIDWSERIPFSETRNYVQRVQEGMMIYRIKLGEKLDPRAPETLLRRVDR